MATAAVLAAVAPIAVAGIRAALNGWIPTWDNAYPALRASDVFSKHPPLLGTRSGGASIRHEINHPGPLEFVLLAPWVRVFGITAGTALGVAATNALCVLGVAWLTLRRFGRVAMTVAMATVASLVWSMGSQMLIDPWGPYATVLPFALLVVAGWSMAGGDVVAFPITVAAASFVLQTYLGYSILVPAVLVLGLGMLGWHVVRRRRTDDDGWPSLRRRLVLWGAAGLVTGLISWFPPLWEQLTRKGGNLTAVIDSGGDQGGDWVAYASAVRLVAATIALPPWWLPPSMSSPAIDRGGRGVSLPAAVLILSVVAVVVVVATRRAWRRGHEDLASALGFMLLLGPCIVLTIANGAGALGIFSVPHLGLVWVYAALLMLLLALVALDEVRLSGATARLGPRGRRIALAAPVVVALVCAVLALPTVDRTSTSPEWSVDATRALARKVVPAVEGNGTVLVELSDTIGAPNTLGPGLMVMLRDADVDFVVRDRMLVRQVGRHRLYAPGRAEQRLTIARAGARPPSSSARLLVEIPGRTDAEDAELAELTRSLRTALDRASGLPIVDGYPRPQSATVERNMARLLASIEDERPAELLGSGKLVAVVNALILVYDSVDDVVDSERFPVDDLERYAELTMYEADRGVAVYLDRIGRLAPGPVNPSA